MNPLLGFNIDRGFGGPRSIMNTERSGRWGVLLGPGSCTMWGWPHSFVGAVAVATALVERRTADARLVRNPIMNQEKYI